jgi:hypothetical protein
MNNTTEIPDHIFCPECKEEGTPRMHMHFEKILPDGLWSWHILDHDGTSKFQWPREFESKEAAKEHITSIIEDAEKI